MNKQDQTILKEEFNKALEEMRRNKAPGVNNTPIELIQISGETIKKELFELAKEIY